MRMKPINTPQSLLIFMLILNVCMAFSDYATLKPHSIRQNESSNSRPRNIVTILKALFSTGEAQDSDELSRQLKKVLLEQSNIKGNVSDCSNEFLLANTDCCRANEVTCALTNNVSSVCYCADSVATDDVVVVTTTKVLDFFDQNKKEVSTSLILLSIGNYLIDIFLIRIDSLMMN